MLSVRGKPKDLGVAKSLASRINSIADSMTPQMKIEAITAPSDKVSKLQEIKTLLDSGFITQEEADRMKKGVLEG